MNCDDPNLLVEYFYSIRPMYISFSLILLDVNSMSENFPKTIFYYNDLPDLFFIDEFHKSSIFNALNTFESIEDIVKLYRFTKIIHDNIIYKLRSIIRPILKMMEYAQITSFKIPEFLNEDLFLLMFEHRRYSQIIKFNEKFDIYSQEEQLLNSYNYSSLDGHFEWLTN